MAFPIPIIDTLIEAALKVFERVIPDPAQKAAAQIELLKLKQAGEFKQLDADLQMALAQVEVNKLDAASNDPFRAGWRPFIGWVCGFGFATQYVFGPWGSWVAALLNHPIVFPPMDMGEMMPLLLGMLGLGAYRTYEKTRN